MVTEEYILKEFEIISTKYDKLQSPVKSETDWIISGEFDIIDSNGYCWETYGIKIILPAKYPYALPILIETSDKIEKHEDWHNIGGICCLSTEAIMFRELGLPISLLSWLDRFVFDFLANHVIKKREKEYAKGEFSHGTKGTVEGYYEIFNVSDPKTVFNKLKTLLDTTNLGRNDLCFCGSRIKFKKCYLQSPHTHTLHGVPISVLNHDYQEIAKHLKGK
jgi:hypothetical protein